MAAGGDWDYTKSGTKSWGVIGYEVVGGRHGELSELKRKTRS